MQIWVDADACPRAIKEVLLRAAQRRGIATTLVANQFLTTPRSPHIDCLVVPQGFDKADDMIVERMAAGDLVITADVPLADQVVTKGGGALNPRGTLYTEQNIKDHLARRDMLDELRSGGVTTGGPPPLDKKSVQNFANALDRYLARHAR